MTNKEKNLYQAILALKNTDEAKKFFRDLCTPEELRSMQERWEIAKLLDQGNTYRAIAGMLKVSTTTVSRVSLWLNAGKGGYRLVLDRLNHHRKSSSGKR